MVLREAGGAAMNASEYETVAAILEQAARAFRQLAATRPIVGTESSGVASGRMTLAVREAAEELSVSRATVYGLIRSGELPSLKIGSRRLIPRTELSRWLAAQM